MIKLKLRFHYYLIFGLNKPNYFSIVILMIVFTGLLGCADPENNVLPSTKSEFLFDPIRQKLSKEDSLSILNYYSRHDAFPGVTEKSKKVTLKEALAEQKAYREIALNATSGGIGMSATNFEPIPYFSVFLRNSGYRKKNVIGLNGTIEVIDEFNEVLMTERVRVDQPGDGLYGELAMLWLPMTPKTEEVLSKIKYDTLGICFKPGLKLKFSDQSIDTIKFPLCYKTYEDWRY